MLKHVISTTMVPDGQYTTLLFNAEGRRDTSASSVSVYAQTCVNLRRHQAIYAHNI